MSTVVTSIAQFNGAYRNYLLRNDEPLTDLVYAQALLFAARHSGHRLSDGTLSWINVTLACHALCSPRIPVADIQRRLDGINAEIAAAAWHDLFLAACRIPA